MRVEDVMTPHVDSVAPDTPLAVAARRMRDENVGCLPVADGDRLVGMVTDRDLVVQVLAKDLDATKVVVSEVATENPIIASPEEPLDSALQRMAQEQVRRLPVVEDGRLVGILAQADVARTAKPAETGQMVEDISSEA